MKNKMRLAYLAGFAGMFSLGFFYDGTCGLIQHSSNRLSTMAWWTRLDVF